MGGKGSLNNSEMVKAVTLAFCSIQKRFIRDIHTKFGILNSTQFPNIRQNSDGGIPDFWSIKITFLLNVTFYFTEPDNRAKKSLAQLDMLLL